MAVFVPDDIRGQEAVQFVLDYHQYMDDQVRRQEARLNWWRKSRTWTGYWMRKWAFIRSIERRSRVKRRPGQHKPLC